MFLFEDKELLREKKVRGSSLTGTAAHPHPLSPDTPPSSLTKLLLILIPILILVGYYTYTGVLGGTLINLSLRTNSNLERGLVGYWSFNGDDMNGNTAYDRSGSGNNGTLTNSPTPTIGRVGQALYFSGVPAGPYVTTATTNLNFQDANPFSVSTWIKTSTNGRIILSSAVSRATSGYMMALGGTPGGSANTHPHKLMFGFGDEYLHTTASRMVYGATSVDDGVWHHVVASYDGSQAASGIKLYIDGIADVTTVDSNTAPGTLTNASINIGSWRDSFGGEFNGLIDEPRIYSRALSAGEVWDLYQEGKPDKINSADSQDDSLEKGLVGYWKLDEGSGTSTVDSSGNANTGTLTNGPTWTTGQIGGATSFDGTDDYIVVSRDGKTLTTLAVSFWLYPTSAANEGVFSWASAQTSGTPFILIQSDGDVFIDNGYRITNGDFTLNTWNHVTLTLNASNLWSFFINGSLIGTYQDDATHALQANASFVYFGSGYNGYADCLLDEVRLYNRALSADEVAKLYKTTAPTTIDTGLVGYWPFNGPDISGTTAYDRSGKGNTGTLTNGPTKTIGKIGQGLSFDGTNDYVDVPYTNLNFEWTDPFSVSGWIKPENFTPAGGFQTLFGRYTTFQGTIFAWCKDPYSDTCVANSLSLTMDASSPRVLRVSTSAGSVLPGAWMHVVLTYDGSGTPGGVRIYKNGTSLSLTTHWNTLTIGTIKTGTNWRIGDDGTSDYTKGSIDEVRVYNRALTQAEVTELYTKGAGSSHGLCGAGPVLDADGNKYGIVQIGTQCWLDRNMNVGTRINAAVNQTNNATIEKWCYSDSAANCTTNNPTRPDGGLYQWDEAMQYSTTAGARGICPVGWHIPTDTEWYTLENYLKDAGQTCNASRNVLYDCSPTGTKLKPGGASSFEGNLAGFSLSGSFFSRGTFGFFWSSSESGSTDGWNRNIHASETKVDRSTATKNFGFPIRCTKD